MTVNLIAPRDYKYSDGTWAAAVAETFQLVNEKRTDYTVEAGYITAQAESEYGFYNRAAPRPTPATTAPPYFFADGSWRTDQAFSLQLIAQKTTGYAATGTSNITVVTATFNPATGQFETSSLTIAGNAPRATTVSSVYTTLTQQPQAGTLIDDCIAAHYVPGKVGLSLQWAENQTEVNTAARRQMQRDSAIVRRVKCAANPQMKVGQTFKVTNQKRSIDAKHMLVSKRTTRNLETGAADMQLTFEFWIR
jgi:hypothetical protein